MATENKTFYQKIYSCFTSTFVVDVKIFVAIVANDPAGIKNTGVSLSCLLQKKKKGTMIMFTTDDVARDLIL